MTYEQAVTNEAMKYQTKEMDCTKTNPQSPEPNLILESFTFNTQTRMCCLLPFGVFSEFIPSALLPSSHLSCFPPSDLLPILPLDAVTVVSTQAAVWQSDFS